MFIDLIICHEIVLKPKSLNASHTHSSHNVSVNNFKKSGARSGNIRSIKAVSGKKKVSSLELLQGPTFTRELSLVK